MESFSNHFLLSMPHLNDPFFQKSLIYICEHNAEGSMGIIINKPIENDNMVKILEKTGLEKLNPVPGIYLGGPVNMEMGLILHNADYVTKGTVSVSKTVALTSNKQIVLDINSGEGPNEFRFSMGYAGWGEGQLEKEIENGDWLVMPADGKLIFSIPDSEKWSHLMNKLGVQVSDFGGSAGLA